MFCGVFSERNTNKIKIKKNDKPGEDNQVWHQIVIKENELFLNYNSTSLANHRCPFSSFLNIVLQVLWPSDLSAVAGPFCSIFCSTRREFLDVIAWLLIRADGKGLALWTTQQQHLEVWLLNLSVAFQKVVTRVMGMV